jgi:hypothetical protein
MVPECQRHSTPFVSTDDVVTGTRQMFKAGTELLQQRIRYPSEKLHPIGLKVLNKILRINHAVVSPEADASCSWTSPVLLLQTGFFIRP